jgi:hypothetical protein
MITIGLVGLIPREIAEGSTGGEALRERCPDLPIIRRDGGVGSRCSESWP